MSRHKERNALENLLRYIPISLAKAPNSTRMGVVAYSFLASVI